MAKDRFIFYVGDGADEENFLILAQDEGEARKEAANFSNKNPDWFFVRQMPDVLMKGTYHSQILWHDSYK